MYLYELCMWIDLNITTFFTYLLFITSSTQAFYVHTESNHTTKYIFYVNPMPTLLDFSANVINMCLCLVNSFITPHWQKVNLPSPGL